MNRSICSKFRTLFQKDAGKSDTPMATMPGVVYISHLPWGFEEQPMKEYFKQFGAIKRLKISRSKKVR